MLASSSHRACRGRLLSSVTLSAVISAALVLPAVAQEAQDAGKAHPTVLDTIVVGAGAPKVAIDTPQAVTVVDQEDIDRDQPRNIGGLFVNVPGVQAAGASTRPLGQAFNIRGIGNAEQAASQNRIIVTVDGAPKFFEQYRTGSFFSDIELYKQVEVLRGPAASTLYGSGAIGGVINFTTKDATDFLTAGHNSAVRFKGAYDSNGSGKTGTVTWAQRLGTQADLLASFSLGSSGDIKDGEGDKIQATAADRWSGLLKGNYHFGTDNDQTLTLSLSRTDSDLENAAVAQNGGYAGSPYYNFMDIFGYSDLRAIDDTITLRYRHEGATNPLLDLDVQLSYSDTKTQRDNFSQGDYCELAASGNPRYASYVVLCPNEASYKTLALKAENTMTLSSGIWENYLTFGAALTHQKREATSTGGAWAFHPGGDDDKFGLYAQGEFVWNQRLTITPGLRIDRSTLSPDGPARAATEAAGLSGGDQSGTSISPKIAALYKLDDSWGVFGSVARTERMPTLDELYSSDGRGTAGRTASLQLEEETATTVEMGLTYQTGGLLSAEDSLTAKATLFHNDLKNLISANPSGSVNVPYFENINSAKIWGGEIEAAYEAQSWFSRLAYSKVKSKDDETGNVLNDTPAENIAFTLGAKLPDQGLRLGWRVQGFSGIETASAVTTAAGYATHDFFVTWKPQTEALGGLQLDLMVENAFDRLYRNNLQLDNGAGRNIKIALSKSIEW